MTGDLYVPPRINSYLYRMQEATHPMRRLFQYLRRYRKGLSLAVGSSILNKIVDLAPPFLTAWLIDTVAGNTPGWMAEGLGLNSAWSAVVFLIVLTIVLHVLESVTEWLMKRTYMRVAQRAQHHLRVRAYQHLQSREMAFFERERTGNLMSVLNDDINQLERFLNGSFNEITQLIVLLLVAGSALLGVNWMLGGLGLLPIPFIIWASFVYQRRVGPHYRAVRRAVGDLGNRLENNISGMPIIKSFTAEDYETQRVRAASAAYREANFRAIRYSSVYVPIIRMFIAFGFVVTLGLGAYWLLYQPERGLTIGSLALFAMLIQRLLWPVTRLGVVFDELERARASARRVFGLLDSETTVQEVPNPAPLGPVRGAIRLEQLRFSYGNGVEILRGIDLEIEPGQTVGIVGATGAGKTTLIKLMLRFYDPTGGTIRLDGHDLRQLALYDLRRNVALVSQDVYLFHGTIGENIAYGRISASKAEVREAAIGARLHEFIKTLPMGYDTVVGERGIKLSGGQRQRLSIARAILKNAPVLILDEATSAVDTATERAIQESLRELTVGRTALVIAHRLSTIQEADTILVMEAGQVRERGTHRELLALDGDYAQLWAAQVGP